MTTPTAGDPPTHSCEFVKWLADHCYRRGFEDGVVQADRLIEQRLWNAVDPDDELRPDFVALPIGELERATPREPIDHIRPGPIWRRRQS